MDDLISRQAAIDAVQQHREGVLGGYEYDEGVAFVYAAAHNHIIDVIKRLPSAQPERENGKCVWCDSPFRIEYYWIDREGCTASFQDEECHIVASGIAKFCPNCGRKLRGEQDD